MPIYKVQAPDGKIYSVEGPEGATQNQVFQFVQSQIQSQPQQPDYSKMSTEELEKAPSAPTSISDIGRSLGMGLMGGAKTLTDVFGAGNQASTYLGRQLQETQANLTPARQAEMARQQELEKRAAESGEWGREAKTFLGGVASAPVQSVAQAVGTSVPTIITGIATALAAPQGALGIGVARIAQLAMGAAQGVGEYKGDVHDAVKQAYKEKGYDDERAEQLAVKAQEYSINNVLSVGGAALLGALDAFTGIESSTRKAIAKAGKGKMTQEAIEAGIKALPEKPVAAPSLTKAALSSIAGEAPLEGLQGGFGQYAQNLALQREGLLEGDTTQGVLGSALRDAAVGALTGGVFTPVKLGEMRSDYKLDQSLRQQKEQQDFDKQLAAQIEEAQNKPAVAETLDLPGGYKVTPEEIGRTEAPAEHHIMEEGGAAPLATVASEEEVAPKIERLNEIRKQEAAKYLEQIDKINEDLNKKTQAVETMEALGQSNTPEYLAAKQNLEQSKDVAAQQIKDLMDKTEALNTKLVHQPGAPVTQVQQQFVLSKDGQSIGAFKSLQDAENHVRSEMGTEAFTQALEQQNQAEQQVQHQKNIDELKTRLEPMLAKFGLKDVGLNIVEQLRHGAEGSYGHVSKLIEVTLNSQNPVRTMRHEAIHALKDLGFFTPQQWSVLQNMAKKKWIAEYLEGQYAVYEGEVMRRLDAYKKLKLSQDEIIEEAIADAFGAFNKNKPPAGMLASLHKKLVDFFEALKNAFHGAGFQTAESVFEHIEQGKLKPSAAPTAEEKLSLKTIDDVINDGVDRLVKTARKNRLRDDSERFMPGGGRADTNLTKVQEGIEKRLKELGVSSERVNGENQLDNIIYYKVLPAYRDKLKEFEKVPYGQEKYSLPIMRGEETPKFEGKKPTVDLIGQYFDNQIKKRYGSKLDYTDRQSFDNAVKTAIEEVNYQINQERSGLDWYEDDVKEAFKQTKKFIPELGKTDNRLLFSVIAGIMSPQTNARDNWFIAAKAFEHYINSKTISGKNPETGGLWQGGTSSPIKKKQLEFLDRMVKDKDMGQKKVIEWLFQDHTVKEINEFRQKYGNIKSGIDGKLTDMKPGLYAFGPKIGPFVSNLNGIHDVTVDKWMTRTFNRYFGTMTDADGKIIDAPTEPQRRAIKALINEVAKNAGIKPYQAQSLLWFYEQRLFTKIGVPSPSYGFSDGGRKYAESRGRGGEKSVSTVAETTARPVKGEKLSLAPAENKESKIVFEVAPDPDNKELSDKWNAIDESSRLNISNRIAEQIVDDAFEATNSRGTIEKQIGSYLNDTNPSFAISLKEGNPLEFAKFLGHALSQKSMVVLSNDEGEGLSKTGAIIVSVGNKSAKEIDEIYQKLRRIHLYGEQSIGGQSTINGEMIILNYSKADTSMLAKEIDYRLGREYNVEYKDIYTAFPEKEDYNYASFENVGSKSEANIRSRSNSLRAKASELLQKEIDSYRPPEPAERPSIRGGIVLGKNKQEGATSYRGVHYGKNQVSVLTGRSWGTGIKGAERERLEASNDPRLKRRIYFYIPKENGEMPLPEAGVGHHVYEQTFANILGPTLELNRLASAASKEGKSFESAVIDAGYDGYAVPSMGMMVILNHDAPVEYLGTRAEISKKEHKLSLRSIETPQFKQWFGDSTIVNKDGTPKVMYHGLAKDTTDFTRKTARGAPIFLTDDPKFAEKFATDSFDAVAKHPEKYLSKEQINDGAKKAIAAIRKDYGKDTLGKEMIESINAGNPTEEAKEYLQKEYVNMLPAGPHIMPLYVRAENPFDYQKPADIRRVLNELTNPDDWVDVLRDGDWSSIESDEIQEAIQMAGFDSFYVKEHGRKNLAVYEPNQVKSATGNTGEYSRVNNDVRYSLGKVSFPTAEEAEEAVKQSKAFDTPEFKRFINQSQFMEDGKPKPMYHGTSREFYEFTGNAIHITDNAKDAEKFAKLDEDRTLQMAYKALTKDQKVDFFQRVVDKALDDGDITEAQASDVMRKVNRKAPDYGSFFENVLGDRVANELADLSPGKLHVMPLYVSGLNIFDFENPQHVDGLMQRLARTADLGKMQHPDQWLNGKKGQIRQGLWQAIENEQVQRAMKSSGFDGYSIRLKGKKSYAVYKSTQLKSITGNVGDFSNEVQDIRYSLPKMSDEFNQRLNETTTAREQKGWVERMLGIFNPSSYNSFRQSFINRYEELARADKEFAKKMGQTQIAAEASAEHAALMSDMSAGVTAAAFGIGGKKGGVPIIKNGFTGIDRTKKGLLEIFQPLAKYDDPEVYRYFQFYSAVKRGARLYQEGRERLIQPGDVKFANELAQKFREFEQIRKDWVEYNEAIIKYQRDAGVLSERDAHEYTKHYDYIPFYRQLDGESTIGPSVYQSISGVKKPKKLEGGKAPLADFLETVVRNSQAAIAAGMKNIAAQKAVEVGKGAGVVREIEPGSTVKDYEKIKVLEKGVLKEYQSDDPLFVDAVKSLHMTDIPFLGMLSAPSRLLREAVTRDPGFIFANLIKDSLSAYETSGEKITPVIDTINNFSKALVGNSPTYQALVDAGIIGGYEFSKNIEQSASTVAKELSKRAGNKGPTLLRPFKSLWDGLEHATTASDAATRMAIYDRVMQETGNEQEALRAAWEVMNFNRKGNSPIVRILTAAVPFLNARIQGLDVFYRAASGKMNSRDAKTVQRRFIARAAMMFGLSLLYAAAVSGDPDYENQEDETKDNNWIVPSLGIKIPIPFEVGTLFKTIPERIYRVTLGNDTGQDFMSAMKRAASSTLPIAPTAYIPQAIKPLLEATMNYNIFTDREIVSQGMKDLATEYQVGPNTSQLAEFVGKTLGLSPLKVDHVLKGYTGTMGMYGVELMDSIMDLNGDSPKASKRFEQMPVIKRFALDPEARGSVTDYYKLKDSVDTAVRTMNMLEKTMQPEEFQKYMQDNIGLLAFKDYIGDLEKTMKQFRDMKKTIQSSPMSGDEKRDALSAISQAEINLTSNIQVVKKTISELQ